MTLVLLILLTITGVAFVWAVTTVLVARLVGATVLTVELALGPGLRIASLGGTEIRLGLPIGSSVRFLDAATVAESSEGFVAGRRMWEDLPLAARLTVHLAGWLPVFLLALIPLGLPGAASELGAAFGQIVRFFKEPAYPTMALMSLSSMLSEGHWDRAAAIVALKVAAINLLPLPLFAGGKILLEIASAATRRELRWPSLLVTLSFTAYILALFYFVQRVWKALPSLPQ